MKILNEYPPFWQDILDAGMSPANTILATYGDTIYNPSASDIPEHLMMHEKVHSLSQGDDPQKWWNRYLTDPYFRIDEEVEAYREQYKFICKSVKDRNRRAQILSQLATSLASPMYGSIITHQGAAQFIQKS